MFSKLKNILVSGSDKISKGIDKIFFGKKPDKATLEELEDLLISADISTAVAQTLIHELQSAKFSKDVTPALIKEKLAESVANILTLNHKTFSLKEGLNVILVCGVNGNGKTTTIGKLAANYSKAGKNVAVAACDTFRAAAVEQLEEWAHKANALLISGEPGADPASVAYKAIEHSVDNNIDVLFIDTAGRLHNQKNLMDELGKIIRVIRKSDPDAPHHSLLVIDATTGQNAYNQVEQFSKIADITGLIVTKLDGTAKAGAIVGIVQKYNLPVYFIGIGERPDDLKKFDAPEFAKGLVGL